MRVAAASRPGSSSRSAASASSCANRKKRRKMGQKSNPIGLRLQVNRTWDSRWFVEGQDYGRMLVEDLKIRKFIFKTLPQAAIAMVVIERPATLCRSAEHTSDLHSLMRISYAVFCLKKKITYI